MKLTPQQKIERATIQTLRSDPFYASVLLGLRVKETRQIPTAATNGVDLLYNPDWVDGRPENGLAVVLVHEVMHVVFGHHLRRGTLEQYKQACAAVDSGKRWTPDWETWQIACDYEVNSLLQDRKDFPPDGITPAQKGLEPCKLAEWYFDKLERKGREQQPRPQAGGDGAGKAEANGTGAGEGSGAPQPGDEAGDGESGGGEGGGQGKKEQTPLPDAPKGMGGVLPHPELTGDATQDARLEGEWQGIITRAALAAKSMGKLPGWMEERLDAMLKPAQINWRVALRQFLTETVKQGVCWSRPHRRMHHLEGFTPANRSRTIGTVMLGVDTSGSMSVEECNVALGELTQIMSSFPQAAVDIVQIDTRIADRKRISVRDGKPFSIERFTKSHAWKGRGGTCMKPLMDLARRERPQCLILVTDGEMAWPQAPGVPVMWLMTTMKEAPFGKTVHVTA